METRKKRTKNFNSEEDKLLLNIVVKYLDVIRNKQSNTKIRQEKKQAWDDITREFNSVSLDEARVADDLKTRWRNIRKTVFAGAIQIEQPQMCTADDDSCDVNRIDAADLEQEYEESQSRASPPAKKLCVEFVDEQSSTRSFHEPYRTGFRDNEYLELLKKELWEKSVQRRNREKRESEEFRRREIRDQEEERRRTEKHELEMAILRATLTKFSRD